MIYLLIILAAAGAYYIGLTQNANTEVMEQIAMEVAQREAYYWDKRFNKVLSNFKVLIDEGKLDIVYKAILDALEDFEKRHGGKQ